MNRCRCARTPWALAMMTGVGVGGVPRTGSEIGSEALKLLAPLLGSGPCAGMAGPGDEGALEERDRARRKEVHVDRCGGRNQERVATMHPDAISGERVPPRLLAGTSPDAIEGVGAFEE